MSADDDANRALEFTITKLSKAAAKKGLIRAELPSNVASGLADQIFFAVDLLKKGAKITPGQLGLLLAQKGLGIFKIASQGQWDCGIAIATVLFSLIKFSAAGPASALVQACSLLYDCYCMDRSCGITDAVNAEIQKRTLPVVIFLDAGVRQWLSRGY